MIKVHCADHLCWQLCGAAILAWLDNDLNYLVKFAKISIFHSKTTYLRFSFSWSMKIYLGRSSHNHKYTI